MIGTCKNVGHHERPNPRLLEIDGEEYSLFSGMDLSKNHIRQFSQTKDKQTYIDTRRKQSLKQSRPERKFPKHVVVETLNIQKKESMLEAGKNSASAQKEKSIRILAYFSVETQKIKRT